MSFAEKIKNIDILTETYINLGPIFFSPRDSLTKGLLVLLHPSLEGITEVDTDPKGGLVSFKVTPLTLMTEFSVLMPLQSIAPGNSWLAVFL